MEIQSDEIHSKKIINNNNNNNNNDDSLCKNEEKLVLTIKVNQNVEKDHEHEADQNVNQSNNNSTIVHVKDTTNTTSHIATNNHTNNISICSLNGNSDYEDNEENEEVDTKEEFDFSEDDFKDQETENFDLLQSPGIFAPSASVPTALIDVAEPRNLTDDANSELIAQFFDKANEFVGFYKNFFIQIFGVEGAFVLSFLVLFNSKSFFCIFLKRLIKSSFLSIFSG